MPTPAASASPAASLAPMDLVFKSSGVVLVVLMLLVFASVLVWFIWFLKVTQVSRLRSRNRTFEREAGAAELVSDLLVVARRHVDAPGARIVMELGRRRGHKSASRDFLTAVAKRALASEQQRATVLMPTLASIASASPFVGLFGTVWGIMDAFLRIGVEKSASLPVVAPAIGEALIATAFGLVAAIPATIGYNYVDKRIADFFDELGAAAEVWVALFAEDSGEAVPLRRTGFPAAGGG
ncbi:MAG TPA: MotA/TolQ/ExbB proton channel family protein [Polyangiaceae bacterium]